jgi:high frequency lysogenization protein
MSHSKYDQTLALAGIYQAASLVKQTAHNGTANSAQVEASLETLFHFDASSVEEVYGSIAGVGHGVTILHRHLTDRASRDTEIARYVISLIMLEQKLSKNNAMLDEISDRLSQIESQLEFFSLGHENTFAKLGQLYSDTISTLGPKIMVTGDPNQLGNDRVADKVRSLLLAGIRSAVLWRQCGGSKWQFLFGRKAYIHECEQILSRL